MNEIDRHGNVRVFEYQKDLSLKRRQALIEYYDSKTNIRKRQVLIELNEITFTISSGAMHWTVGQVSMVADSKNVGDFLGKTLSAKKGNKGICYKIKISGEWSLNA